MLGFVSLGQQIRHYLSVFDAILKFMPASNLGAAFAEIPESADCDCILGVFFCDDTGR